MAQTLLQFDSVSTEAGLGHDSGLWDVSFKIDAGEMMMIRLEASAIQLPLADAAAGLIEPRQGKVAFEGIDWLSRGWDEAGRARGRIGRVFADGGWVHGLDVEANITLAQRHHTRRPLEELRDEAASLARLFSLPGLPRTYPLETSRLDLLRAACVRAFLGKPSLIILEWIGANRALIPPLLSAIRSSLRRGSAVLWLSDDSAVWSDPGITANHRATMAGSQFIIMS